MANISNQAKQRVPAAERRDALIDAAIEEFALGGLHGTPVDRIARRVGVAQPYVFSLFPTKRDLFIAAVERGFEMVSDLFTESAAEFKRANAGVAYERGDILAALGDSYIELLASQPAQADAPAPGLRRLRRRGHPRARERGLRAARPARPRAHRRQTRMSSTSSSATVCG